MSNFEKLKTTKSFLIVDLLDINKESKSVEELSETLNYYRESNDQNYDAYYIYSNNESELDGVHTSRSRKSESISQSRSMSRSSSSSSCNLKKNRKSRTAFSDHQLNSLEKSFEKHKYLSVQDRIELASKLNLTDTQVKTWYQNRRTKWKRQSSLGIEWLMAAATAENSSVLQQFATNNQIQNEDKRTISDNDLFQFLNTTKTNEISVLNKSHQTFNNSSINNWFINALSQYSIDSNPKPKSFSPFLSEKNTLF